MINLDAFTVRSGVLEKAQLASSKRTQICNHGAIPILNQADFVVFMHRHLNKNLSVPYDLHGNIETASNDLYS